MTNGSIVNFLITGVLAFLTLHGDNNPTNQSDFQDGNGTQSVSNFTYTSYNTKVYCTPSSVIETPPSIKGVQDIVRGAINSGKTVKAVGSLHSINDVICTEGIPIQMTSINYARLNDDDTVTLGVGIELTDALQFLHTRNRSLIHVPTFGGITIGGAMGTGAHGSSLIHPPSISDQVIKVTIVDGLGNIQEITDPEDLKAFKVHLGLLGVLIDVTLPTVPLFKMKIENTPHPDSILTDGTALKWAAEQDAFSMWWFPSTESVIVANGTYVSDISVPGTAATYLIPDQNADLISISSKAITFLQWWRGSKVLGHVQSLTEKSLYKKVIGKPAIYSEDRGKTVANPATGYACELLQNRCTDCAWSHGKKSLFPEDFSVSVNIEEMANAVETVKSILAKKNDPYFFMIGVFLRFSKASDSFMATSSGQAIVDFEWIGAMMKNPFKYPKYGLGAFQTIQQALVSKHKGRPHWGKNGLHYISKEVLEQTAPNKDKFISAMRKFDPNGIFLNKFGARLLGTSEEMNVNPKVTRCALQDYCLCKSDADCGKKQQCRQIDGYFGCFDRSQKEYIADKIPFYDPGNYTSIMVAFSQNSRNIKAL